MSSINEKTVFPLKLVLTIVGAAVMLTSVSAVAQFQIHETAARVQTLEAESRDHDRRLLRSEDFMLEVRDSLKEIKQDVKELRRTKP
jgi:hypothetical protein